MSDSLILDDAIWFLQQSCPDYVMTDTLVGSERIIVFKGDHETLELRWRPR